MHQVGKQRPSWSHLLSADKSQLGTTLQQLSLSTEQCLHGLWALLEVAHPANGLRLLDELAVTPMNHLVVRLPPAAVLCELEAWRKTLLLLLGLLALTQDLPITLDKHLNSCRCSTKNCSTPLFFTKAVMQQNTTWCFKAVLRGWSSPIMLVDIIRVHIWHPKQGSSRCEAHIPLKVWPQLTLKFSTPMPLRSSPKSCTLGQVFQFNC